MSNQITYDNKVDLQVATNIANINKVTASDMNEIKSVVNGNATATETGLTRLETDKLNIADVLNQASTDTDKPYSADYLNDKLVSVGTSAPTDGRKVWFEKGKNLFDGQLELGMYDETGAKATNNANYRNVEPINVQPSTTYTFSINGTSQKYVVYFYKKDGTFISANDSLTNGTFTTPAETYFLNFRCFNADFTSNYANLKIQLEQGSTATSYEPYIEKSIKVDNEDFISMSNLVSVGAIQPSDGRRVWFKKSKNLFNINGGTAEGTQNVSIVIDGNTIKQTNQNNYARSAWKVQGLETNKQYTLSLSFTNTNASSINARVYKSDGSTLITQSDATTNTSGEIELTFTAIENIVYVRLYSNNAQTSNTYEVDFSNIQLEQGSTATTYEPYVEPSINVDEEEWYSKPKVLWTNLAPTSGFASQTITLNDDISNYKYYEILSIGGQGIPNTLYSTGRLSTEKSQTRLNVIRQYLGYREVTINGTSVTFGNYGQMNTYGNATLTTNNTVCLPYKILGYK